MGFIVIEGIDGSGKSTQIKYIEEYFLSKKEKTRFIHFPRTDQGIWGELISRFLRGDLGKIIEVNPYLVALIYAGDRKDFAPELLDWKQKGFMVIADRYLYSNIAFQCAKISDNSEKEKLARWIKHLEYEYNQIPIPDLNLFLNVPREFTMKSLGTRRLGTDRNYLNGGTDIHEADLDFQERVRETYIWQVRENEDFEMIECSDDFGKMLRPVEISKRIIEKIEQKIFE